ncbi:MULTISPECIES: carboxymuconolactone decarboxylase family protein [unclassified Rhodanobacter]|jgi:AhpD family alkylhydroperoxidase|uniref:Carboxymuconolactone decarboxylase family protein n=1 Tax=Rhodanobacter humi TaxID=1888173 RepID=A0ABV4AVU7_9GAMM|nr:MAG: carboxymuconolactone decarboxylase family protein [Rhodanobacter sp.]TBR71452.1 MAG: carboxymuconolactone decarboxylase family protein [Burkholderiaceae bacterium]
MSLKAIDPVLDLMGDFAKVTHGVTRHIQQMRQAAIFTDGALPARQKALAAMLWSISARCEPCIVFYVQQAVTFGATEAELGDVLAVASTMGGCVGEMWALKAYKAYKDVVSGQATTQTEPSCCA